MAYTLKSEQFGFDIPNAWLATGLMPDIRAQHLQGRMESYFKTAETIGISPAQAGIFMSQAIAANQKTLNPADKAFDIALDRLRNFAENL